MTKKDMEEIRKIVAEAVREALTVEATIERVRDPVTGQPLAVPERRTGPVFIPSLLAQMIPFQEGAFRGVQADLKKREGELSDAAVQNAAISAALISMQPVLTRIAEFVDFVKLKSNDGADRGAIGLADESNPR